MPRFVFNDEKEVNSYGFSIPNKGINMARFKGNPVMLDQHYNSTRAVIGKWLNISVDGTQLQGDSEFDTEDDDAKKIAGKVDRGYIKGASMGVTFNREYMKQQPDGSWQLSQCELFEVSIVAVPSNRSSLTLFAPTGKPLTEEEIKLSISELQADYIKPDDKNKEQMEKFTLSVAALAVLGLQNADNQDAVSTAVLKLEKDLSDEKAAHVVTKNKITEQVKLQATTEVDAAILAGKLTAAERDETINDYVANPVLTSKLLAKLPTTVKLGGQIDNTTVSTVLSMDDFQKLPLAAQLKFQAEDPEGYKALFTKK
jgi:HK97 family phage prohead protease